MLISIEELKEKQGGCSKRVLPFFLFLFFFDFFLSSIAGIKVPAKKPKNPFWGFLKMGLYLPFKKYFS
jgi:hypothetical protein